MIPGSVYVSLRQKGNKRTKLVLCIGLSIVCFVLLATAHNTAFTALKIEIRARTIYTTVQICRYSGPSFAGMSTYSWLQSRFGTDTGSASQNHNYQCGYMYLLIVSVLERENNKRTHVLFRCILTLIDNVIYSIQLLNRNFNLFNVITFKTNYSYAKIRTI